MFGRRIRDNSREPRLSDACLLGSIAVQLIEMLSFYLIWSDDRDGNEDEEEDGANKLDSYIKHKRRSIDRFA